jgi:hypothetical protein
VINLGKQRTENKVLRKFQDISVKDRDKVRKPSTEKQRKNRKGRGTEKKVAD